MRTLFFMFLLLPISLISQASMASTIIKLSKAKVLVKGVDSIEKDVYSTYAGEGKPDTIIKLLEDSISFYINGKELITYHGEDSLTLEYYDKTNTLQFIIEEKYDAKGKIISDITTYQGEHAELLNTARYITYDKKGRLTQIKQNQLVLFNLEYLENGLWKKIEFDPGMMMMQANVEEVGDTLRYTVEGDLEQLNEMFGGEKGFPRERIDLLVQNDTLHFYNYSENMENSKMEFSSLELYDLDYNLLSRKGTEYGMEYHLDYIYSKFGKLLKVEDKVNGSSFLNEYENELLTKSSEEYKITFYEYDDKGNVILEYSGTNEYDIDSFTISKYTYKD